MKICISFFILCVVFHYVKGAEKVDFVATIFRHGDRTPISFYPNDPWADRKYWPLNFGQLTDKGMLQHYELGLKYRQQYEYLLSTSYDSEQIYVRSTDFDRTIMSALCNLAGLFKVDNSNEFIPGLKWKPIPIHTITPESNDALNLEKPCPRYDWELSKLLKSDYFKQIYDGYKPLFEFLTEHTGKYINTLKDASFIYDALLIEQENNYTLPNWTSTVYPDILRNVSIESLRLETHTPEMKRLKTGPIIKEILRFMDGLVSNSSTYKFVMYSAHDTTIAAVLNSLGMYNLELPPYAAHIVFELLSPDPLIPEHKIRIKYQDEILNIPGCGTVCALSQFKTIYQWLIPNDHSSECQLKVYETNHWKMLGGVLLLLAAFCVICAAVIIFRTEANHIYLPYHNPRSKIVPPNTESDKK